jgi:hypothetical protein
MRQASTLGDLLALSRSSSADLHAWLQARDSLLVERLAAEAQARGETLAQFLRIATADFLADADEESWIGLVSAMRDGGADPGAVCVARVMAFRIALERRERRP